VTDSSLLCLLRFRRDASPRLLLLLLLLLLGLSRRSTIAWIHVGVSRSIGPS
jgi:hypothetical protein